MLPSFVVPNLILEGFFVQPSVVTGLPSVEIITSMIKPRDGVKIFAVQVIHAIRLEVFVAATFQVEHVNHVQKG
jgi:hypothetical protein